MDELEDIEIALLSMCRAERPDLGARPMYGGMMFEEVVGAHSTRTFGVFRHKAHVTIEFSNGADLADPAGRLSGTGKHRRNLKFTRLSELKSIEPEIYIRAARSAAAPSIKQETS